MIIDSNLNPDKLNDAIHDTIRVFDNYGLSRKTDKEGRFRITDYSKMGTYNSYYTYYITGTDSGASELYLEGHKVGKQFSLEDQEAYEKLFLKNLNKIIDKDIPITAEVANKELYKEEKGAKGVLTLILLVLAIASIFYGIKLFFM
jgi:hypothetical protein